jgi:hypothetical protein
MLPFRLALAIELCTSIFMYAHMEVLARACLDGLAVPEVRMVCLNCVHMHA